MNENDIKFTPESVDEQVEQLLSQTGVHSNVAAPQARMVRDLQDAYDDEEILAHVWSDLVEHIESKSSQRDILERQAEPQIVHFEETRPAKPFQRTWLAHMSLIAAVLVTALVVGSMLGILTLTRQRGGVAALPPQQNASPSGIYIGVGNGVFRIDRQTHKVLWKFKLPAPPLSSCGVKGNCTLFAGDLLLAKNMLYVPLQDGTVDALDANTGAKRWSHKFGMFLSQITMIDGKLWTISTKGSDYADFYVTAFNPVNGVEEKHYHVSLHASGPRFSVVGQTLYAYAENKLYAFNLADGTQIWHQQIDQKLMFSGLQVVNGVLYTVSTPNADASSGYVYAFNARTGAQIWRFPTVGNVLLTVSENIVYLSANQYMLYAYSSQTGKELWHRSLGAYASETNTVVHAGILYIAGSYGENTPYRGVLALSAKDGSLKWKTPENADINPASGPVLTDGVLYVGDLALHAFNAQNGSALWSLPISGLDVPPVIETIVVAP
jgi:outer membrane protein assembly factor BamB